MGWSTAGNIAVAVGAVRLLRCNLALSVLACQSFPVEGLSSCGVPGRAAGRSAPVQQHKCRDPRALQTSPAVGKKGGGNSLILDPQFCLAGLRLAASNHNVEQRPATALMDTLWQARCHAMY